MKAAVLHEVGGVPRYEDFPDPAPAAGDLLVRVRAVAVENVDRAIVNGTHYTAARYLGSLPMIPCFDGVGELPDGRLIGFGNLQPPYGALAELAAVPANGFAPIPAGIDPAVATVLSSAVTGMAMKTATALRPGETVLIQGATGVAGKLAVQIAHLLGAGRVVATGRDDDRLAGLDADAVINTSVDDEALVEAYRQARGDGYDVVVDYLWSRPTELLLRALTPDSFAFVKPTRLVQIGESAGPALTLSAAALRTSGVELLGASRGLADAMAEVFAQVVEWTTSGKLTFDLTPVPLSGIATAWQQPTPPGSRLVVLP